MNAASLLPPHFLSLSALCALGFIALWWVVLASGRTRRRRGLRQRAAAADADVSRPLPLDLVGMQEAIAAARRAARQDAAPQAPRRSLYAIPWFLFLGDEAANVPGLLRCAGAGPSPPGSDGSFWRWHFLQSTIAIEIGPLALGDRRERGRWYRALLELAERRERLPLNGLVACVAAAALLGDADGIEALAARLRLRIDEAVELLRTPLPLYLVVTGLEQLAGFEVVRGALPPDTLKQALGHRLTLGVGQAGVVDARARLDGIFDELLPHLRALRMALLSDEADPARRHAIHAFVEQLRALQPGLRIAVQRLFDAPPGARTPRWRGFFLASGPSEGGDGAFIADLFDHFLPADQPLAG